MPATGKTGVSGVLCQQPKSDSGAPGLWCEDLEQVRVSASAPGTGPRLTGTCACREGTSLSKTYNSGIAERRVVCIQQSMFVCRKQQKTSLSKKWFPNSLFLHLCGFWNK